MFEKEKRKAAPTRLRAYILAGVLGIVSMIVITIIISLDVWHAPLILEPVATMTAPVERPLPRTPLNFHVDESAGKIGLSYKKWEPYVSFIETRPWSSGSIGKERNSHGSFPYYGISSFTSILSPIYARSENSDIREAFDRYNVTGQSLFSINGEWLVTLHMSGSVTLNEVQNHAGTPVIVSDAVPNIQGVGHRASFSPDNTLLVISSVDDPKENREYVEVFNLLDLNLIHTYVFEGLISSPIVFSRDNSYLAFMVDKNLRVLSLTDDQQTYFDVGIPIKSLAIDATGEWVAVLGSKTEPESNNLITLYSLDKSATIPTESVMTQTIRMDNDVIGLQFVKEGLLVGDNRGNIILYNWTGEDWNNPTFVMTTADLK